MEYSQEAKEFIMKLERSVSEPNCIVRFKDKLERYIKRFDSEWLDVYVDHSGEVGNIITWIVTNESPKYDEKDIIYQLQ